MIVYEFNQYSLKHGLKELGEKGETAVTEKLYQIHMGDTLRPKSAKHLTEEQKWYALEFLIFLKVKKDGRVKGRTCVYS